MNRAMTKDRILFAINLLMRDIANSNSGQLLRIGEKEWELRLEDVSDEFDEYLSSKFLQQNQKCEVKSFIMDAATVDGYALLTVRKVIYTTLLPVGFGYTELEFTKDIDTFDDVQLLCFLMIITQTAYLACGDFPEWFLFGYDTEQEWLEEKKRKEDEQ